MLKHLQSSDDWNEKGLGAKGFTLIELLVVIVILGILAAVVVFAVGGIQDRGQKSACETEARTVRTAQEAYYAQYEVYTPNGARLVTEKFLSKAPTLVTDNSTTANLALVWAGTKCSGISGIGTP